MHLINWPRSRHKLKLFQMVTVLSIQNFAFTDLKELISPLLEVKQTMGLTSFAEVQRAQSDRGRAVTKAPRLEVISFTMGIFILA